MSFRRYYERYCHWCESLAIRPAPYTTWLEVLRSLPDARRISEP